MITTFYFDNEMFDDASFNIKVTSDSILDKWEKFGCLAFCKEDIAEILQTIKQKPNNIYHQWYTALAHFKKTSINLHPSKLYDLGTDHDYDSILNKNGIMTAIVPSEYLELFENKTHVEIIEPQNIFDSINFKNSEKYSLNDISEENEIEEIWNNSFKNLSIYTNSITIIDRYLMKNAIDDHKNQKETSIEVLAKFLAKNNKPYTINIYSACDIDGTSTNSTEITTYLNDVLRKKPYVQHSKIQFSISYCKGRIFSKIAHDRMMAFDQHVVETGNGVDIFRVKPISNCQLNIKNIHRTKFKEIYALLSKNRETGLASL